MNRPAKKGRCEFPLENVQVGTRGLSRFVTCRNSLHESVELTANNKSAVNVKKKPKISTKSSNDGDHVHLKNGLFVMCSYPIKLRKSKREVRECSPEVVALLLPEPARRKQKKRAKKPLKLLRVLLDSGATANTICARHARKLKKKR